MGSSLFYIKFLWLGTDNARVLDILILLADYSLFHCIFHASTLGLVGSYASVTLFAFKYYLFPFWTLCRTMRRSEGILRTRIQA